MFFLIYETDPQPILFSFYAKLSQLHSKVIHNINKSNFRKLLQEAGFAY